MKDRKARNSLSLLLPLAFLQKQMQPFGDLLDFVACSTENLVPPQRMQQLQLVYTYRSIEAVDDLTPPSHRRGHFEKQRDGEGQTGSPWRVSRTAVYYSDTTF